MSTEITRPYRKRRRAELEAKTRLRITEASMQLHEEVGPAQTTVSAVAERAGVQRATVYRHFSDVDTLIEACSAHWTMLNPAPDLEALAAIDGPELRLRTGLDEIYGWYEDTSPGIERVLRDRALVAPLDEQLRGRDAYLAAAGEILARGRPERGRRRELARAAIAHGLEYDTWRSLTRRQGLSRTDAVELVAAMVAGA